VADVLGFFLGLFVGFIFFTMVCLPLVYGLPMAIYYVSKGVLRWGAILTYIGSSALWSIVFLVVAFVLVSYFPAGAAYVQHNAGVFAGQWFAIVVYVLKLFGSRTRQDLRADFADATKRYVKSAPSGVEGSN